MENLKLQRLLVLLIAAVAFVGCAEKKETNPNNNSQGIGREDQTTPIVPGNPIPTEPPNTEGWGYAAGLTLDCAGFHAFSYRNCNSINFDNTKVYYNLEKISVNGKDHYKGSLRVYYSFNQQTGNWGGVTQMETIHKAPLFESGGTTTDIRFNRVYKKNGQSYMVGFYEEKAWDPVSGTYSDFLNFSTNPGPFGSIMIVLDGNSEAGWTGKLYFRNFIEYSYAGNKPQSNHVNYKCWNITEGPYSCREFVRNNNSTDYNHMLEENSNGNVTYPNFPTPHHYTLLGTIGGSGPGMVFP